MAVANSRMVLTADVFMREWHRVAARSRRGGAQLEHRFTLECVPVSWLLPDLLRLAHEMADAPLDRFESALRRLLSEQHFVGDHGDASTSTDHDQIIEQCVQVMLNILRRTQDDPEHHESHLAAPQMFG